MLLIGNENVEAEMQKQLHFVVAFRCFSVSPSEPISLPKSRVGVENSPRRIELETVSRENYLLFCWKE